MVQLLAGLLGHALGDDQSVTVLGIPLEAEQADCPLLAEGDRLAEIEQGLRPGHVLAEHLLESLEVARAGRLAPALRRAEPAQMAIGYAGLGEMCRKLAFGKALLAGDWRRANVEHKLDARLRKRRYKGPDGRALIANGADCLAHGLGNSSQA